MKGVRNNKKLQIRYLLASNTGFALGVGVNPVEVTDIGRAFRLLEVAGRQRVRAGRTVDSLEWA